MFKIATKRFIRQKMPPGLAFMGGRCFSGPSPRLFIALVISFIVPAHNEAPLLGETLAALHQAGSLSGQHYEVLVVNDSSTDDTTKVAREHLARVVEVGYRQIAASRNTGAREARGDVLIFVDADTLVSPTLVNSALHALWRGACGGGAAIGLMGRPGKFERLMVAMLCHAFRWTKIAPGCFIYCTKDAFEGVGGFDERLFAAEDVALSRALARTGRFEILREKVRTSDRKMRTHGWRSHLSLFGSYMRHGRRVLGSRDHLDLWYGERRHP